MDDYLDEFTQFIDTENTKDKYSVIQKQSIITINSKDRNLTNETNYNFSINFNTNNPDVININTNFKNIVGVELLGIIVPNIYEDLEEVVSLFNKNLINSTTKPLKLKRIGDYPFLLLNISELKNKSSYGSNISINKATYVLVPDDIFGATDNNSGNYTISQTTFTENGNLNNNVVAGADKRTLYLKDYSMSKIKYYTPQNYLGNLELSITTPEGKVLKNLNDFLEIYRVYKFGDGTTSNPYRLRIKFYKYFSGDEYKVGDKLLIKDLDLSNAPTNGTYGSIIQFLERKEGHTIIEIAGRASTSSKLYSEIGIPFDYRIDLEVDDNLTGASTLNTFNMDDTATATVKTVTSTTQLELENIVNQGLITTSSSLFVDGIGIKRKNPRKNDGETGTTVSGVSGDNITLSKISTMAVGTELSFHNTASSDATQNLIFPRGKAINLSLQISLGLRISYEQRENQKLQSNLL